MIRKTKKSVWICNLIFMLINRILFDIMILFNSRNFFLLLSFSSTSSLHPRTWTAFFCIRSFIPNIHIIHRMSKLVKKMLQHIFDVFHNDAFPCETSVLRYWRSFFSYFRSWLHSPEWGNDKWYWRFEIRHEVYFVSLCFVWISDFFPSLQWDTFSERGRRRLFHFHFWHRDRSSSIGFQWLNPCKRNVRNTLRKFFKVEKCRVLWFTERNSCGLNFTHDKSCKNSLHSQRIENSRWTLQK